MKKTLITLLSLSCVAMGATTVADMDDLVALGTIESGVTKDTSYGDSTVYNFTGDGAIININSSDLLSAITSGSGYITIAAWIKADSYTSISSIFSYGAQSTGFKFTTSNSTGLTFTAKGANDYEHVGNGSLVVGEWERVALTLNLGRSLASNNRYWFDGSDTDYYTRNLGAFIAPADADQLFAIGSGNCGGNRENFVGQIANLAIFTTTEMATADEIKAAVGAMPTAAAPVPVPEPTTATLSLLALAGLAARRRRK